MILKGGNSTSEFHDTPDQRYRAARRVTLIGSFFDLLLGIAKILVGWIGASQALMADGVHSLSDLATDALVLVAAKSSSRAPDQAHPYGHGRIETLAMVALGFILALVAAGIAWDAIGRLFETRRLEQPGAAALIVAGISVIIKEGIYRYSMGVARRQHSGLLAANAWHSRSDALSSVVVIIGVMGTQAGLIYMDAIAAVIVSVMILEVGGSMVLRGLRELIDTGLNSEEISKIERNILSTQGVASVEALRTRRMGSATLLDAKIQVEPRISVSEAHAISDKLEQRLKQAFPLINDVLIHVEPLNVGHGQNRGAPPRNELVSRLKKAIAAELEESCVPGFQLHYLSHGIQVDIAIPLQQVSTMEQAQQLKSRIEKRIVDDPAVSFARVFFS